MKMGSKYIMRRRVAFGVLLIVGFAVLLAGYYLVNHIWWTGNGWCFGDLMKCESGL